MDEGYMQKMKEVRKKTVKYDIKEKYTFIFWKNKLT